MDHGAPSSPRGPSRAVTKPRPSEPVDPRTEQLPVGEPLAAGAGSASSDDLPAGGSPGQRLKRRLAASGLLRAVRDSVIDAPDAPDDADADGPERREPRIGTGSPAGPILLPPIRTSEGDGERNGDGGNGNGRAGDHADARDGDVPRPTAAPLVGPQAPTESPSPGLPGVPGELVAQKVVVPPSAAPLDVPLDAPPDAAVATPPPSTGRPSITFQRRRTRPRVRRVTRVVRHIDTWSVFKVALVFSVFLYAVALTAGVLLWHVAMATGTVDNVERFFEGFGWRTFQFKGGEIYHNAWIAGMFAAIGLTGLAVLIATMFNLITDLVGGIRVSVLEEEVLARRDRTAKVVVESDPDAAMPYDQARSG